MRSLNGISLTGIALLGFLFMLASAARADVRDNAHVFSDTAIQNANAAMAQMQARHGKQFVVETFPTVPDELKSDLEQKGKDAFFRQWMADRAKALGVNGVYVLISMDPHWIEVGAGKNTLTRDFTASNVAELRSQLKQAFKSGRYDEGLQNATDYVEQTLSQNIPGGAGRSSNGPGAAAPGSPGGSFGHRSSSGFGGFGTWLCLGVGVLVLISLLKTAFRGGSNSGGYGYGGGYGPSNYPPGGGYGPGYGGGGRSGFGSGFLGGLLGGAVGGYAADRMFGRDNTSQQPMDPNASGGSFGGGGGGFDAGPSDAGQGFGDGASGGDFGGGGGDSGGGGGDSGGSF